MTDTADIAPTASGAREGWALDAATLSEAFQRTAAHHVDQVALRTPGGKFEIAWGEYARRVRGLAGGLAAQGIDRGDTVAMMLTNRPESLIVDAAALHIGAIPFSIYNTSAPEQIEYLFAHSESRVVVTEAQFADRILAVRERLPALQRVFVLDGARQGAQPFTDLEAGGPAGFDFERAWRAVAGGDVATLIYTSGTTGPPKAVELTHENLMWQLRLVDRMFSGRPAGRRVSYLPMAHLADRLNHYFSIVSGASVTCVSDPMQVVAALPDIRPTAWGAVPRIWEKLKAALEAGFAAEPDERRRAMVAEALRAAIEVVRCDQAGVPVPPELRDARARADALIFSKVRARLGLDDADTLISGAAPIAPDVLEFFAALGLPICEGWGMTETTAITTINPREQIRIGTVGRALPGVEVALAEDGELLVRGPTVMRGYRKDSEKTAATIDADGWLHTGDIGEIDHDGYVKIVDRKKELIINAAGKNMSPANIEAALKSAHPLIGQAVAIGDRRPYNVALIVLDPDVCGVFAREHGIEDLSLAVLACDERVRATVAAAVGEANTRLSRVEQIKRHAILPHDWEPGGEELTPTMKLKRKPIAEKYAAEIEALYT
ncbi:MAG TPA: AMP-binding protein [Solirubrobacteraceae bacterium]|nr:AMP-binding protein [Solirubrobacteraceae bacterium]